MQVNSSTENVVAFRRQDATSLCVQHALDRDEIARVELLRRLARESLLCSKADLERAGVTMAVTRDSNIRECALALLGALSEFASRRLVFYPPGCREFSDCEIWLSRALRACEHSDNAGGRALIAWRVRREGRRRVQFLVGRLATAFTSTEVIAN